MIVVFPTRLATGYKLEDHPVTKIRVDSLPADSTATFDVAVEIKTFKLIYNVIGRVSQLFVSRLDIRTSAMINC